MANPHGYMAWTAQWPPDVSTHDLAYTVPLFVHGEDQTWPCLYMDVQRLFNDQSQTARTLW